MKFSRSAFAFTAILVGLCGCAPSAWGRWENSMGIYVSYPLIGSQLFGQLMPMPPNPPPNRNPGATQHDIKILASSFFGDLNDKGTGHDGSYSFRYLGGTAGADIPIGRHVRAGMVFGYGDGEATFSQTAGRGDVRARSVSTYIDGRYHGAYLSGALGYAKISNSSARTIWMLPDRRPELALAKFNTDIWGFVLSGGYDIDLWLPGRGHAANIGPTMSIKYTDADMGSFHEQAIDISRFGYTGDLEGANNRDLESSIGVRASGKFNLGGWLLSPMVGVDYTELRESNNEHIFYPLGEDGRSFVILPDDRYPHSISYRVGMGATSGDLAWSIGVSQVVNGGAQSAWSLTTGISCGFGI